MSRLLLAIALLFGFAVGAHAQDNAAPDQAGAPPAAAQASTGGAPDIPGATAPAQPIAFNHKLHVQTAKLGCNDCHEPNRGGATLAMPQPTKCMLCHAAIATDKPDVQLLAQAAKDNELVAWVRLYRVPSFVTFSHKTHTSAGAKCEDCHGPVSERTVMAQEKDLKMGGCIACHQTRNAPAGCDTCHATMTRNGHSPFDADTTVLARLHIQPPAAQGKTSLEAAVHSTFPSRIPSSLATWLTAPDLLR